MLLRPAVAVCHVRDVLWHPILSLRGREGFWKRRQDSLHWAGMACEASCRCCLLRRYCFAGEQDESMYVTFASDQRWRYTSTICVVLVALVSLCWFRSCSVQGSFRTSQNKKCSSPLLRTPRFSCSMYNPVGGRLFIFTWVAVGFYLQWMSLTFKGAVDDVATSMLHSWEVSQWRAKSRQPVRCSFSSRFQQTGLSYSRFLYSFPCFINGVVEFGASFGYC